jgi:hypothetical protein
MTNTAHLPELLRWWIEMLPTSERTEWRRSWSGLDRGAEPPPDRFAPEIKDPAERPRTHAAPESPKTQYGDDRVERNLVYGWRA